MALKKPFVSPVKGNHADMQEYIEMMNDVETAIESRPIDFEKLNKILYNITSPDFKYPHVEKCCKNCTAPERNEEWKNAIDRLKEMEGLTDYNDLIEIYELSRLHLLGGGDVYGNKFNKF